MSDAVAAMPKTLKEVLEGDQKGYRLGFTYFAELKHGLMGCFPAVFKGTNNPVISADEAVMKRVWATMTPRRAQITRMFSYINDELGVSARLPIDRYEYDCLDKCGGSEVLTSQKLDELLAKDPRPFEWAPGLIGDDMSREEFQQTLEEALKKGAP